MMQLAIIGLGGWGRRLVDSVQGKSDLARFAIAVVTKPESHADYAAAHGLRLTNDLDAAVEDGAVDGVVSCGPAHLHAEHSLRALEAGKPVLAIKPLALAAEDAKMLAAAADKRGLLLALGYNRCFFPNVAEMRKRLRVGALGRLVHAEGDFCVNRYRQIPEESWKNDPDFAPAGSLGDHLLYLTIETLGPIAEAHALAFASDPNKRLAETTAVLLRTAAGQSAAVTAIGATAEFFRFQLFGDRGWIELRGARHFAFQGVEGEREEFALPAIDAERMEVEAFVLAARGERPFPVPVADAVRAVETLRAISRSAREGRPVAVE
jgi:predicted dehydrogenase